MRAAVIDVGANTVKLTAGELDPPGRLRIVADCAVRTRLSEGIDSLHVIGEEAVTRTVDVIRVHLGTASELGAERVRVVATSAIRDARNREEVTDDITRECKVTPEVLSEQEEARLSYLAAATDLELAAGEGRVVIDVGGGSTEFAWGSGGEIAGSASMRLGAVRLTERCLNGDMPGAGQIAEAAACAEEAIAGAIGDLRAPEVVVVGGTAVNLARVWKGLPSERTSEVHGARLSCGDVRRLVGTLSALGISARAKLVGLDSDRADIILGGAIIIDRAMAVLEASGMVVSIRGMRHGALYELLGAAGSQ